VIIFKFIIIFDETKRHDKRAIKMDFIPQK